MLRALSCSGYTPKEDRQQAGSQRQKKRLTRPQAFGSLAPSDAGWSSQVARRAHNPKVAGSNPAPATKETRDLHNMQVPFYISAPGNALGVGEWAILLRIIRS
jgi:hypothetical protein